MDFQNKKRYLFEVANQVYKKVEKKAHVNRDWCTYVIVIEKKQSTCSVLINQSVFSNVARMFCVYPLKRFGMSLFSDCKEKKKNVAKFLKSATD